MARWLCDYTPEQYIDRRILYFERQIKKLQGFLKLKDGDSMLRMLEQRGVTLDDIRNRITEYEKLIEDYKWAWVVMTDKRNN